MSYEINKIFVSPDTNIVETLKVIDESAIEIALVVDEHKRLLGTVTDGDIRRGLIKGATLNGPICDLMNKSPIVAKTTATNDELLFLMLNKSIKHLPIVDKDNHPIRLVQMKDLIKQAKKPNVAVIMAGGLGSRLGGLTKNLPKPMLPVGGKPIIANIAEQLCKHGFVKIYISVNYKAEVIVEYFKNNPIQNAEISFLHESKKLGTAGSIALLPGTLTEPFIVVNGDILSAINYENLVDFHNRNKSGITVCAREFSFQIPYGVLKIDGNKLSSIEEKPFHSIFINAGVYVMNPEIIKLIKPEDPLDMPDLIKEAANTEQGVSCYPLSDFWLDIGTPADYSKIKQNTNE